MKFLPLIWAGLWRKKMRTILTLLSIIVAFLLFGLLQGVSQGTQQILDDTHVNRLFVISTDNMTRLPVTYRERIAGVDGIDAVAIFSFFGSEYRDPKNSVPVLATDIQSLLQVYPELEVSSEQVDAMNLTRTGALAGSGLMTKFGWKVGDALPLHGKDGTDWTFTVVGIVTSRDRDFMNFENRLIINYGYFAEQKDDPSAGAYIVSIVDPARATSIGQEIDRLFVNSPAETETRSEKEFAETAVKQMGDITFFINAIVAAAFFTLLFLTGTTLWQSVRERIPEFGVLKTLGFSDEAVVALIVAESLVLYVFSALAALLTLVLIFPYLRGGPDGSISMALPPVVLLWGLALAIVLALASGAPPAWRVRRLAAVDALAGR
jgi:putative ABC transport system permease protein